jgi:hypothetical protein
VSGRCKAASTATLTNVGLARLLRPDFELYWVPPMAGFYGTQTGLASVEPR